MKNRVVCTGVACLSPYGNTLATQSAIQAGTRQIINDQAMERFGFYFTDLPSPTGLADAYVQKNKSRLDRLTVLSIMTYYELLENAGLVQQPKLFTDHKKRIGAFYGSALGCQSSNEKLYTEYLDGMRKREQRMSVPRIMPNSLPNQLSMFTQFICQRATGQDKTPHPDITGFQGTNTSAVAACATGLYNLALAVRAIEQGDLSCAFAGSGELITPYIENGFRQIGALGLPDQPDSACAPFRQGRTGTLLAEGVAMLALEDLEFARSRGAQIMFEILGSHTSCDGDHLTFPNQANQTYTIEIALKKSGLAPENVQALYFHGTGTQGDQIEFRACLDALGPNGRRLGSPINGIALRWTIGHSIGASAIFGLIHWALAQNGDIPPLGYDQKELDREFQNNPILRVCTERESGANNTIALFNAFGFGGPSACVVAKRFEPYS